VPNRGQVEHGMMAVLGELLTDEAPLGVVPEVDRGVDALDAEMPTILLLAGDRHALDAHVGKRAGETLAGVAVDQGHGFVVEAGLGELPVAGRPAIPPNDPLPAARADAPAGLLRHREPDALRVCIAA